MGINEQSFENHIVAALKAQGYERVNSQSYDKTRAILSKNVIDFIKNTQAEKYQQLQNIFGTSETDNHILQNITKEKTGGERKEKATGLLSRYIAILNRNFSCFFNIVNASPLLLAHHAETRFLFVLDLIA